MTTTYHNGASMTNTVSFTTPAQIDTFRAKDLLQAMKLYLNTGMQVNRMYTPANMKRVVSEYTGTDYPRSRKGLEQAYNDLLGILTP
jgi:hypothetical protein